MEEEKKEGLDVDEFYGDEDGSTEAEVKAESESQETSEEEIIDSTLKSTAKAEETEPESSIANLLENPESKPDGAAEDGRTVPLDQHIKLRKRAQAAEAKAAELESKTQPAGENAEKDPLSELDDEDYLSVGQVKGALARNRQGVKDEVMAEVQAGQAKEQAGRIAKISLDSEAEVRKANADYDKTTQAVNQLGLIDDADRQKIFASNNPAQTYYEIAAKKLSALRETLGVKGSDTPTKETNADETNTKAEDEAFETDDEAFDAVFGESA